MEYEINFLILQSNTVELANLRQEMEDLIKSCDCEVLEKKEYLKRKLAYEINREGYGFHTVLRFKFPEGKVDIKGLKNKINLNFKVARYLIIRPDGLDSLKELEKKAEVKNKEDSSEGNTVVKQEEVEKILAKEKRKEVKPVIKPRIKPEAEKDEIKKEDIEKIKETEDKKEQQEKKDKEIAPAETPSADLKDEELEEKETESKEEKSKKEEKKSTKDKDKVSLDDLDKKLDEILNI